MAIFHEALGPLLSGTGSRAQIGLRIVGDDAHPCALIWVPEEVARDPELVEKLRRETSVAAALEHPNIVRVFGLEEVEEGLARAVEFADGESLRRVLDVTGPLPPGLAARIVFDAALGVQHAHTLVGKGHAIVHGDLRPETLLVTYAGVTKVSGYGALDVAPREMGGRRVVGRRWYCAPEQLLGGRGAATVRTDVYLLGVVLYEALTGEMPFAGDEDFDSAVVTKLPSHLDSEAIAPELRPIVARAMAKEAEARFATVQALRQALDDAMGPLPERAELAAFLYRAFAGDQSREARRRELDRGLQEWRMSRRSRASPVPPPPAALVAQWSPPASPSAGSGAPAAPDPCKPDGSGSTAELLNSRERNGAVAFLGAMVTPAAPEPTRSSAMDPGAATFSAATATPAPLDATATATPPEVAPSTGVVPTATVTEAPVTAAADIATDGDTSQALSLSATATPGATPTPMAVEVATATPNATAALTSTPIAMQTSSLTAAPTAVPTSIATAIPPAAPPTRVSAATASPGAVATPAGEAVAASPGVLGGAATRRSRASMLVWIAASVSIAGAAYWAGKHDFLGKRAAVSSASREPSQAPDARPSARPEPPLPPLPGVDDVQPAARSDARGRAARGSPTARASATLEVVTDPPLAVSVDGKRVGRAPCKVGLTLGRHRVALFDAEQGIRLVRNVFAKPGSNRLNLTVGKGTVVVTAPPGCDVRIDGRLVGKTPLDGPATVFEGSHRIRVSLGAANWQENFTVADGERVTVDVHSEGGAG